MIFAIAIPASGARSVCGRYALDASRMLLVVKEKRNVAKYTEKSEAELAWDRIRREIQYKINLAASHWRAEKQNELLPIAQARFEDELAQGHLLSLDAPDTEAEEFIAALAKELGV